MSVINLNSIDIVNGAQAVYSAVLPPSLMVFHDTRLSYIWGHRHNFCKRVYVTWTHAYCKFTYMTQASVRVMLLVLILPFNSISCTKMPPTKAPGIAKRLGNRDSDKGT